MRSTLKWSCVVVILSMPSAISFAGALRSSAAGSFAIELDRNFAGFAREVGGGFAIGNVVEEAPGAEPYIKKHLEDPPGYKEISITFGGGMSASFYNAIAAALAGSGAPHNGAVVALDSKGKPIRRMEFFNAVITQLTIPEANASKLPAKFVVVFSPQSTQISKNPGGSYSTTPCNIELHSSNFRFDITGLLSNRVSNIGPIVINVAVPFGSSGDACVVCPPPPKTNFPEIDITIPDAYAAPVIGWYEDFVITGNNADSQEKEATLEFLDTSNRNVLLRLSFTHLGITQVSENSTEQVKSVTAHLYVESIALTNVGAACGSN